MGEWINDRVRAFIGGAFLALGALLELHFRWRLQRHPSAQRKLRLQLGIEPATPLSQSVAAPARNGDETMAVAETSGTLSTPKRISYSRTRLRQVKWIFFESLCRIFRRLRLRRASLFVLAPMSQDASLTSLLIHEKRTPPWWICVQAPYRIQSHVQVSRAVERYGQAAVKAWLLTVSNPGLLYATNPSTLAILCDDLRADWERLRALARDEEILSSVRRKIASTGCAERLAAISGSSGPLPLSTLCPALDAFIGWDGGYVRPFLDRARAELSPRCTFIPMYSMSTEVVETIPTVVGEDRSLAFLPMAPGVLYEFLPEDAEDVPGALLRADELRAGGRYVMVVSDAHGSTRYQTGDVFECLRFVHGLPDLRFLRRRHLAYSFTGEKLTGNQCHEAFEQLLSRNPELRRAGFLTCFPSSGGANRLPHYKVVLVERAPDESLVTGEVGAQVDGCLAELNAEFRAKRETRRLGAVEFVRVPLETFLQRAGIESAAGGPPAQFKFLPLYPRLWEAS